MVWEKTRTSHSINKKKWQGNILPPHNPSCSLPAESPLWQTQGEWRLYSAANLKSDHLRKAIKTNVKKKAALTSCRRMTWPGNRTGDRRCPRPWRSSCRGRWPARRPPRPGPDASGYLPVWRSTDAPRMTTPGPSYWKTERTIRASRGFRKELNQTKCELSNKVYFFTTYQCSHSKGENVMS